MQELPKHSSRYGMISVARTNSNGTHLVGSDIEHQQFVTLKIHTAEYERHLLNDWYFPQDSIIEVSMSLSQWAEFISSPNTTGVPCTLERIQGKCLWKEEAVPFIDKIKLHEEEYESRWKSVLRDLYSTASRLQTLFEEKSSRKEQREAIQKLVNMLKSFEPNEKYALEEFEEHVEKRINQAKTELSNYIANFIQNKGNKEMIQEVSSTKLLGMNETENQGE